MITKTDIDYPEYYSEGEFVISKNVVKCAVKVLLEEIENDDNILITPFMKERVVNKIKKAFKEVLDE